MHTLLNDNDHVGQWASSESSRSRPSKSIGWPTQRTRRASPTKHPKAAQSWCSPGALEGSAAAARDVSDKSATFIPFSAYTGL